jgi:hypothetical protein
VGIDVPDDFDLNYVVADDGHGGHWLGAKKYAHDSGSRASLKEYPIPGDSGKLELHVVALLVVPGTGTVIANVQTDYCGGDESCHARIQVFRR